MIIIFRNHGFRNGYYFPGIKMRNDYYFPGIKMNDFFFRNHCFRNDYNFLGIMVFGIIIIFQESIWGMITFSRNHCFRNDYFFQELLLSEWLLFSRNYGFRNDYYFPGIMAFGIIVYWSYFALLYSRPWVWWWWFSLWYYGVERHWIWTSSSHWKDITEMEAYSKLMLKSNQEYLWVYF